MLLAPSPAGGSQGPLGMRERWNACGGLGFGSCTCFWCPRLWEVQVLLSPVFLLFVFVWESPLETLCYSCKLAWAYEGFQVLTLAQCYLLTMLKLGACLKLF